MKPTLKRLPASPVDNPPGRRASATAVWLATCGLAVGLWSFSSQAADDPKPGEKKPPNARSAFMRAKLASNELVLEGIVTENFEKIEKGVLRLQLISAAEEWRVRDDDVYKSHSEEFRRILKGLKDQAQAKNFDGASLKYVEMTLSCLKCHQAIRQGKP